MYGEFPMIPTPEIPNPMEDSSYINQERYAQWAASNELKRSNGWGYSYGKNRLQHDEDDSDREYDRHNDA